MFPTFLKTPTNVVVKSGTTARLDCAATGSPQPEISLQKDGGDDFPAARERRMHIFPSDEMFFIVDIKSEDQGLYTCIAKNDVGVITANASLQVLGMYLYQAVTRRPPNLEYLGVASQMIPEWQLYIRNEICLVCL